MGSASVGSFCYMGINSYLDPTQKSLINVKSLIIVQADKISKKNKRTGRKYYSISVQVSVFHLSE